MSAAMTEDEMVRALMRDTGCNRARAVELVRLSAFPFSAARPIGAPVERMAAQLRRAKLLKHVALSSNGSCARLPVIRDARIDAADSVAFEEAWGARLAAGGVRIVLPVTPRTKKNGGGRKFFGIDRKGSAYAVYRDQCHEILQPLVAALDLPLPPAEYNLAATFYVDRAGERADRFGLEQALADILQRDQKRDFAGVVTDDWQFRTGDGTRIIPGDERPRVEFTITPLQGQ